MRNRKMDREKWEIIQINLIIFKLIFPSFFLLSNNKKKKCHPFPSHSFLYKQSEHKFAEYTYFIFFKFQPTKWEKLQKLLHNYVHSFHNSQILRCYLKYYTQRQAWALLQSHGIYILIESPLSLDQHLKRQKIRQPFL